MPAISLQSSLKVSDEVVFRELDGEAVLLNLASGMYFGLDETGTRIWQLIDQHGELAAVLIALCEEFDAPRDAIEHDLLSLASELSEKGLLVAGAERAG
jgi:hypothetical protein